MTRADVMPDSVTCISAGEEADLATLIDALVAASNWEAWDCDYPAAAQTVLLEGPDLSDPPQPCGLCCYQMIRLTPPCIAHTGETPVQKPQIQVNIYMVAADPDGVDLYPDDPNPCVWWIEIDYIGGVYFRGTKSARDISGNLIGPLGTYTKYSAAGGDSSFATTTVGA